MKKQEEEFQHFIFEHVKTHELVQIKIGPMPIGARELEKKVKDALKEQGKDPDGDSWTVSKAWCGPDGCKPPRKART